MLTIFILLSLKVILPYKVTMVPKYMLVVKEKKYKAEFISGTEKLHNKYMQLGVH